MFFWQIQEIFNPPKNIASIEAIGADCQLLIVSHLSELDLLSLAKSNKYFFDIVEYEFGRRFSTKTVWFDGDIESSYGVPNKFRISDESVAVEILKLFGHLIQNLKISNFETSLQMDLIYNLIKEICPETLVKLDISYNFPAFSPFQNIRKIFKKVKTLELYGDLVSFGSSPYDLNDTFPVLEELEWSNAAVQSPEKWIVNLPHLKYLYVGLLRDQESLVIELLRKNPQILRFAVSSATPKLLKGIADLDPIFEEFSLFHLDVGKIPMCDCHFKNVIKFTIHISYHFQCIDTITFSEKLEEIEFGNNFKRASNFIDFIKRNEKIKRLRVIGDQTVTNNGMQRLALTYLNVKEIHLHCADDVTEKSIIQLIENTKLLNRLTLRWSNITNFKNMPDSTFNMDEGVFKLSKSLENKWKMYMKLDFSVDSTRNGDFLFFEEFKGN